MSSTRCARSISCRDSRPKYSRASSPPAAGRSRSIYPAEPAGDAPQPGSTQQSQQIAASGDGFELNFDNSPVASVAKVVLGDILGVGYVDRPARSGQHQPVVGPPDTEVRHHIRARKRAADRRRRAGQATTPAYRLVPQADAVGAGATDTAERMEPGYGVSVVPLQHVSAQTVVKLVDSFAVKPGMVRADASRNLVLIQGSGSERRNAVDLVLSFDADWMRGQSVGIFPVQNSNPEPVIAELEKIMDSGEGGIAQNIIKFQAIPRMNAVLAVTRKAELLKRVETWITRLDNTNRGRSAVHVYHVKYGEARQIARVLNEVFAWRSGIARRRSTAPPARSRPDPAQRRAPAEAPPSTASRQVRPAVDRPADSDRVRAAQAAAAAGAGARRTGRLWRGASTRNGEAACSMPSAAASPADAAAPRAAVSAACWRACASPPTPSTIHS